MTRTAYNDTSVQSQPRKERDHAMRAARRDPRRGAIPMTAQSQSRSLSAAHGRVKRPLRGVVSNRSRNETKDKPPSEGEARIDL